MTRNQYFLLAAVLAGVGGLFLVLGVSQLSDARSYVAKNYQQYSSDSSATRYACNESPATVAAKVVAEEEPEAHATDRGTEYLRYDDYIVKVGADNARNCSIQVEDLAAGYSRGSYVFLGPGFTPGSPAGGSGGSPGGPDDAK